MTPAAHLKRLRVDQKGVLGRLCHQRRDVGVLFSPGNDATVNAGETFQPPKTFAHHASVEKIRPFIVWVSGHILMVDYFQKCQAINAEYYTQLVVELRATIGRKRPGKLECGVSFLRDRAPCHTPFFGSNQSRLILHRETFTCSRQPRQG